MATPSTGRPGLGRFQQPGHQVPFGREPPAASAYFLAAFFAPFLADFLATFFATFFFAAFFLATVHPPNKLDME